MYRIRLRTWCTRSDLDQFRSACRVRHRLGNRCYGCHISSVCRNPRSVALVPQPTQMTVNSGRRNCEGRRGARLELTRYRSQCCHGRRSNGFSSFEDARPGQRERQNAYHISGTNYAAVNGSSGSLERLGSESDDYKSCRGNFDWFRSVSMILFCERVGTFWPCWFLAA